MRTVTCRRAGDTDDCPHAAILLVTLTLFIVFDSSYVIYQQSNDHDREADKGER